MDSDQQTDLHEPDVIHNGLTSFPTYRHLLTFAILCLLEAHGIYICFPFNKNANMSFLIGQVLLLIIIFYSWFLVLSTTPGPMSQLFNQEFLKKTIDLALNQQTQPTQSKACTKCQMDSMAKLYHCQYCNRCVYKHFFHSKWLNTCIAKENFPQFTAFLVFLEIYLILLEIDNIIFYVQLRSLNQDTFSAFFMANFQNALASSLLFIISFLVLAVMSMIAGSFFMALRVKGSVEPLSTCIDGCQGMKKKSSHDKILMRLRQSVRQSNYLTFNRHDSDNEGSNRHIFRETDDMTAKELNVKSIKKSFMLQSMSKSRQKQKQNSQMCSIADFQGPYFKTDFFGSAKIFKKKQTQSEKKKRMSRLSAFQEDMTNMTTSKWKRYVQATFEQDRYAKRMSSLQSVPEKRSDENDTPAEMLNVSELNQKNFEENKENICNSTSTTGKTGKRKLISKFSKRDQDEQLDSTCSPNIKKLRFVKKSTLSNLAQICQKQQKLEDA